LSANIHGISYPGGASGRLSRRATPRATDLKRGLRRAKASDPFFTAVRERQMQLIVDNTLAAARDSLRAATRLVTRRADTSPDPFLRHHLLAAARDVAAIEAVLEASLWPDEQGPPCLARALKSELCWFEQLYAGHIGPIDGRVAIENFTPSWTAEIIFRLIARAILYDTFINAHPHACLSVQLSMANEMICLSIDGAGFCTGQVLLSRIDRPRQFKMLLRSLRGNLVGRSNGISVNIPAAACAPVEEADDVTLY
jgi:hypothetical protein